MVMAVGAENTEKNSYPQNGHEKCRPHSMLLETEKNIFFSGMGTIKSAHTPYCFCIPKRPWRTVRIEAIQTADPAAGRSDSGRGALRGFMVFPRSHIFLLFYRCRAAAPRGSAAFLLPCRKKFREICHPLKKCKKGAEAAPC